MITREELDKLVLLARIEVPEQEKDKLQEEMEAILGYVSELQEVATKVEIPKAGEHRNVMREDTEPIPPGFFSLADGYVKVKKILNT